MSRLLLVVLFLEAGLVLLVVPWLSFWDRNYFVEAYPLIGAIAGNNFVRGGVSGVGLVNIAAGAVELFSLLTARRIEEHRPPPSRAPKPKTCDVRGVACFITDRRRFGPSWQDALLAHVAAAARAGVALVQIREPGLDDRTLTALVARAVGAVVGTRTRVLVNDRLDVALAAGAHGVHLRADSVPAPRVRALAPPPFLVGRSVHSAAETASTAAEGGLDYLLFGTVFETPSKPGRPAAGVDALRSAVTSVRLPVLAVGGVTLETVGAVAAAGAAGFAAIGLFAGASSGDLQTLVPQACSAFDRPNGVP